MIRLLTAFILLSASYNLHAGEATEVVVSGVTVSSKALAAELKTYIDAEMKAKDGWIIIQDDTKGFIKLKPTKLDSGAHIHRVGKVQFLSWGEFKSEAGDDYMIDFYFDLKDGKLVMNAPLTVYSRNKMELYKWDESGPIMKKLKVKAAK